MGWKGNRDSNEAILDHTRATYVKVGGKEGMGFTVVCCGLCIGAQSANHPDALQSVQTARSAANLTQSLLESEAADSVKCSRYVLKVF